MERMENGFIKAPHLLEELVSIEDLLDFSEHKEKFIRFLKMINKSAIIALVGRFGIGKSTLLKQIENETKDVKWVNFEAWMFPERRDLWEGFVLEFARQLDTKIFEETRNKIDGNQNNDKKTLISTIACIPGLASIKNLNHFLDTSPARRVYEIQNILKEIINKQKQDIYITVEDIDRSGDAGVYFLETIKQFISTLEKGPKILVIVPVATHNFEENKDSFLKCVEYVENFDYRVPKLEKFVKTVFNTDLINDDTTVQSLVYFFEELFRTESTVTPRLLKHIIRNAEVNYLRQCTDGYVPDFRVSIMFEASKHFKDVSKKRTFFNDFISSKKVKNDNIFAKFLFAVLNNRNTLYSAENPPGTNYPPKFFKLFKPVGGKDKNVHGKPYSDGFEFGLMSEEDNFCLFDYYLNY